MEVITQKVHTAKSLFLPLQETLLMPVGDTHYEGGGPRDNCDLDRFQRHLEWGMKHGAYFLGMGDLLEVASPSNRQALIKADLYDSVQDMIEDVGNTQLERFKQIIKGTEGQWLGLLEGHHFYVFEDGTTSDTRLCQFLKAPFLGNCAFVRLLFTQPTTSENRTIQTSKGRVISRAGCTIWCHHGTGGGRLTSAPLNLLEHVIKAFDADIYLIGHQHKKVAAPLDRVYVDWKAKPPKIRHRRIIIGCTGGFLLGYKQGSERRGRAQGTYVEKRLLNPTALGGLVIYIRPRHEPGRYHLDLSVEQ